MNGRDSCRMSDLCCGRCGNGWQCGGVIRHPLLGVSLFSLCGLEACSRNSGLVRNKPVR